MKESQVTSYKPQAASRKRQATSGEPPEEFTEIFAAPPESAILRAEAKLHRSLTAAKTEAILYGQLEHQTVATLYLAMRNEMVVAVDFGINEQTFIQRMARQFDAPVYFAPEETAAALKQVQEYLDGQRTSFDLPTDLSVLTDFQRQVLTVTQQIPRGRIATYMEIARKIGNPKAVRAVGQALGRNPIPIVIPCHRVIASDGSLGGYSGGGGLATKAKLLQLEGAMAI